MRAAGREIGLREIGLGHRDHPLLGRTVLDTATGRTGVLRAICPEPDGAAVCTGSAFRPGSGPPVAWLAPVGGGVEWTTAPETIREVAG